MNDSLLEKMQARFVQDPVRNVYAKFKINRSAVLVLEIVK